MFSHINSDSFLNNARPSQNPHRTPTWYSYTPSFWPPFLRSLIPSQSLLFAASVATAFPQPQSLMKRATVAPSGTLVVYSFSNCYMESFLPITNTGFTKTYTLSPTGECVNTPPLLISSFLSFRAETSPPIVPAGMKCDFNVFSGVGCTGNDLEFLYTCEIYDVCQEATFRGNLGGNFGGKSAKFNCSAIWDFVLSDCVFEMLRLIRGGWTFGYFPLPVMWG